MAARKLKIVSDEPAEPQRATTIRAASELSHRDLLVALRETVADQIDQGVPAHALDKLVRSLRDLNREIGEIDAADDKGDDVGEAADTPDEAWPST